MLREEFIKLIGTETIVTYSTNGKSELWSMVNFTYDEPADKIDHSTLSMFMLVDVFVEYCRVYNHFCMPALVNRL